MKKVNQGKRIVVRRLSLIGKDLYFYKVGLFFIIYWKPDPQIKKMILGLLMVGEASSKTHTIQKNGESYDALTTHFFKVDELMRALSRKIKIVEEYKFETNNVKFIKSDPRHIF